MLLDGCGFVLSVFGLSIGRLSGSSKLFLQQDIVHKEFLQQSSAFGTLTCNGVPSWLIHLLVRTVSTQCVCR